MKPIESITFRIFNDHRNARYGNRGSHRERYALGFPGKATESKIELRFALQRTVSEIQLKTYLPTQQFVTGPKIVTGPKFPNIPTRLPMKGHRVPNRAPFRSTTHGFRDTGENRKLAQGQNSQRYPLEILAKAAES